MIAPRHGPLALVLAVVIAASLPALSAARPHGNLQPTPSSGPGDLYLALGDSLAAGIGATRPDEHGYPALLRTLLERQVGHSVQLANRAVPGETTVSFQTGGQLDAALQTIADARQVGLRVSPITISLGVNDLLRAGDDPSAREQALLTVEANLHEIFSRLRAATADATGNATADLIATTYYDPVATTASETGSDAWWLARLNDVIANETALAGGLTADLSAAFHGHESDWTWYPTDIHPTNAGHEAIAQAIWRTTGYDTTPPAVEIAQPAPGPLARPIATVSVLATDQVGITEVSLWVDGQDAGPIPFVPALGQYATLWDTRTLSPGSHALEVRAADAAGNVGAATASVDMPALPGTPGVDP